MAADWRQVAWVVLYFWATWLAWVDVGVWLLPVLMYLSFAGATIAHNSMHVRVFSSRAAEAAWRCAVSLVYGHPVNTFVSGHNKSHHAHMETAADPMHTTQMRYRWPLLNLLLFHPTVAPRVLVYDIRYLVHEWREGTAYAYETALQLLVVAASYAFLLHADPWRCAVLWWAPHLFAQWAIVTMNILQHRGCKPDSDVDFARNFTGRALNYLTFNNGFHTIHHLRPATHWSEYPALHAARVAPRIQPHLDQRSMLAYIAREYVLAGPSDPPAPAKNK